MDSVGRVGDVNWQEDAHKQINQHIEVFNTLLKKTDDKSKLKGVITNLKTLNSDIQKGLKKDKDTVFILLSEVDLNQDNVAVLKKITQGNVSRIAAKLEKPVLEFLCGDYSCDKIPKNESEIIDYHKQLERTAEETLIIFKKLFQLQSSTSNPIETTNNLIFKGTQLKDQGELDAWCNEAREYLEMLNMNQGRLRGEAVDDGRLYLELDQDKFDAEAIDDVSEDFEFNQVRARAEAVDASDLSKSVKINEKVTSEPEVPASQNLRLDRLLLQLGVINDVKQLLDEAWEKIAEDKQESIEEILDTIEDHKSILDDLWDAEDISTTEWKESVDTACSEASTLLNDVLEFLSGLKDQLSSEKS